MLRSFILSIAFITAIGCFAGIAQSIKKTIHVKVRDASTGNTIEGAQVTYKGLFGKTISDKTDAAGQATIVVSLISRSATGTLIVSDGQMISGHNTSKTTISLFDTQDYYEVTVSLSSDYKNISVTVNDKNGAVYNAKVILKGARDPRDETGYTNPGGKIALQALLIDNSKTVPVIVEKEGYKTYTGSITLTSKVQVYSVNVSLERDLTVKRLRVNVIGDDDNLPLPDATVEANAGLSKPSDYYSGRTDPSGNAEVAIKTSGDYTIRIEHRDYFPSEQPMKIIKYDDAEIPPISVRLKRKTPKEKDKIDLVVTVFGDKYGQVNPLAAASITVEHLTQMTGMDGKTNFEKVFMIGNTVKIKASARNFETVEMTTVLDNTERYTMATQLQRQLTLKYKAQDVKLWVKVQDEQTNKPIGKASVTLKTSTGKVVDFGVYTNVQGEAEFLVNTDDLTNAYLKAVATAADYQERWSDVPNSMLTTADKSIFTIYLKKKEGVKEAGEKMYGPYTITPGVWLQTGLKLKKGQSFRVEASGIIQYKDPPNTQNTPDGGGYWGWWQLKGKINEQIIGVGSRGGGTASADGMIELGAPATVKMGHAEEKALEGHYTVYVFSKYAVEDKSPLNNANTKEKLATHAEFLDRIKLFKKATFEQRTVDEIIGEIRSIIAEYELQKIKGFDFTKCLENIKKVLSLIKYTDAVPSKEDMDMYYQCIEALSATIKEQANRQ